MDATFHQAAKLLETFSQKLKDSHDPIGTIQRLFESGVFSDLLEAYYPGRVCRNTVRESLELDLRGDEICTGGLTTVWCGEYYSKIKKRFHDIGLDGFEVNQLIRKIFREIGGGPKKKSEIVVFEMLGPTLWTINQVKNRMDDYKLIHPNPEQVIRYVMCFPGRTIPRPIVFFMPEEFRTADGLPYFVLTRQHLGYDFASRDDVGFPKGHLVAGVRPVEET